MDCHHREREDGSLASVWGVYIDSANGVVLASDMRIGLWIVKPNGLNNF